MMFNMKSMSIAFPKHTTYSDISIISVHVFYQEVDEGRAITSHISSDTQLLVHGLVICIILVNFSKCLFLNDPINYNTARCFCRYFLTLSLMIKTQCDPEISGKQRQTMQTQIIQLNDGQSDQSICVYNAICTL